MRNRARRITSAVIIALPMLATATPVFAAGRDGEEPGDSLSLISAIGLFVGIPVAVIGLLYFIAYVPKRKSSNEVATRD